MEYGIHYNDNICISWFHNWFIYYDDIEHISMDCGKTVKMKWITLLILAFLLFITIGTVPYSDKIIDFILSLGMVCCLAIMGIFGIFGIIVILIIAKIIFD